MKLSAKVSPRRMAVLSAFALAIAAAFSFAPAADAATANTSFSVTATVDSSCSVSGTNLAFGMVNPLAATAVAVTNTVTAVCTSTTPYTIALSAGSGTMAQRTMLNGTAALDYQLYGDSAHSLVLGDGSGSTHLLTAYTPSSGSAGVGNGLAQTYTVYGELPLPQTVAPGSYTDTINVTVTY